jgi:hypothetical protein
VPGHLYDFVLMAHQGRKFDYGGLLERSRSLHRHLVHVCLDSGVETIRLTVPAVLGSAKIIELLESFLETARSCLSRSGGLFSPEAIAGQWPEYVLGPKDPMTFLAPDMPCAFFNA